MISVRKLAKSYGTIQAIKPMSFEVGQGEIVGLLGQNGAGKTTIMKIITGFLEPTAGTITVGGADVLSERLKVQKQIGYMPENAPLYPEMLVQEYLMMMAELKGIPEDKQKEAVIEAIKSTGLEDWLLRPISTLSKGFRQRVGLCQAILHKPDVLILDEPTNGLDPVQIVEIRALIKRLAVNSTVFLSTHILPEIEAVCDRVIVLIDGELAQDAPLDELLSTNLVRLSLAEGAQDVAEKLRSVEGVVTVGSAGKETSRPGFNSWIIESAAGAFPIPAIIKKAQEAGWEVGRAAAESPSLEQVFRKLMEEHVKRLRSNENKEVAA